MDPPEEPNQIGTQVALLDRWGQQWSKAGGLTSPNLGRPTGPWWDLPVSSTPPTSRTF